MSEENMNQTEGNKQDQAIGFKIGCINHFTNNPFLTLYNIAMIIGGAIAYKFFIAIDYLPDFDLKNAATFLIGIALVGVVITFALALYFAAPGWLLHEFVWKKYFLEMNIDGSYIEDNKEIIRQKTSQFVKGSLWQCIGVFFVFLLIVLYLVINEGFLCVWGFLCFLFFQLSPFVEKRQKPDKFLDRIKDVWNRIKNIVIVNPIFRRNLIMFSTWAIAAMILFVILIIPLLDYLRDEDIYGIIVLFGFVLVVMVINSISATLKPSNEFKRSPYIYMMFVGLALTLFFLSLPGNRLSIAKGAFRSFALGDIPDAAFLVNKSACDSLNIMRTATCISLADGNGYVRPKLVLSRLGTEYLLSFDNLNIPLINGKPDPKTKDIKIPLRKIDVIAWSIGVKQNVKQTDKKEQLKNP